MTINISAEWSNDTDIEIEELGMTEEEWEELSENEKQEIIQKYVVESGELDLLLNGAELSLGFCEN